MGGLSSGLGVKRFQNTSLPEKGRLRIPIRPDSQVG